MIDDADNYSTPDRWTVDSVLAILQRQVSELRTLRDLMQRDHRTKPPEETVQLMQALLQLKAISSFAGEIAQELDPDNEFHEKGEPSE